MIKPVLAERLPWHSTALEATKDFLETFSSNVVLSCFREAFHCNYMFVTFCYVSQRTDSTWKQMRWIEEAVHNGRNQSSENSMLMSIKRMREGNERKANSAPFSTIIKPPGTHPPLLTTL